MKMLIIFKKLKLMQKKRKKKNNIYNYLINKINSNQKTNKKI